MFKLTSLQRKLIMAATGLFLCFFLVIHLLGNLQLLLPVAQAQEQFNNYSELLAGNILIKIISWVLYLSLLAHAVYALIITRKNSAARGTRYGVSSTWSSRNMGLLGTIILVFLVIHFKDFWVPVKFGHMPLDKKGNKDLYTLVIQAYEQLWYVILYEVAFVALGFHLLHGFFSSARTLGLYHPKYVQSVKIFGWIYTAVITLGFMLIPIYIHFKTAL
jgi:succinate dehydrogenase / fumarate reductase, cytochrome b subunit